MNRKTTLTVRLSGSLSDHVAANVGNDGAYDNVSEYVRDLIRSDQQRKEQHAFDRLQAELQLAFNQPDDSYRAVTAAEIIQRNQAAQ